MYESTFTMLFRLLNAGAMGWVIYYLFKTKIKPLLVQQLHRQQETLQSYVQQREQVRRTVQETISHHHQEYQSAQHFYQMVKTWKKNVDEQQAQMRQQVEFLKEQRQKKYYFQQYYYAQQERNRAKAETVLAMSQQKMETLYSDEDLQKAYNQALINKIVRDV